MKNYRGQGKDFTFWIKIYKKCILEPTLWILFRITPEHKIEEFLWLLVNAERVNPTGFIYK